MNVRVGVLEGRGVKRVDGLPLLLLRCKSLGVTSLTYGTTHTLRNVALTA